MTSGFHFRLSFAIPSLSVACSLSPIPSGVGLSDSDPMTGSFDAEVSRGSAEASASQYSDARGEPRSCSYTCGRADEEDCVGGPCPEAVAIAAGGDATCAVLSDGTVDCWGYVGPGLGFSGIESQTPVPVAHLDHAVAVAATASYCCALLSDGTVGCWGDDGYGSLGDGVEAGASVVYSAPRSVLNVRNARGIASGADSCALISDGTIQCWGDNTYGELGDGTTNLFSAIAVFGPILPGPISVAAGGGFVCALLAAGTVECWGSNLHGELGNGTTTDRMRPAPPPVPVSSLSGATAISAGGAFACALLSGGTVDCWGDNTYGQLGNGTTTGSSTPVVVSNVGDATGVAAGGTFACALLSGGAVQCWGSNKYGQLGSGATSDSSVPMTVQSVVGASAIAAGYGHACAIVQGGNVVCWGENNNGQLGDGTWDNSSVPMAVNW